MAGNMENPGKRLIVLEGDEVEATLKRRCEFRKQPEGRQCGRNPSGIDRNPDRNRGR